MGIVEKFKNMIGAGLPKVTVVLDHNRVERGSMLKGKVMIAGGDYPASIRSLDIMLGVDQKTKNDTPGSGGMALMHIATIPYNDYVLHKSETVNIPFEVKIPEDTFVSGTSISNVLRVNINVSGSTTSGQTEFFVV